MNIEVQICGLLFDILIIFFLLRHEGVGLFSEKIFKICIAIYTSSITFDILSIIGIEYTDVIPEILTLGLCKTYLVTLIMASYISFVYTYSDVTHLRENYSFRIGNHAFALIGCVMVYFLHIGYIHEGRKVYSYGPSVLCAYLFSLIFILSTFITTLIYGKQMNMHRRKAIRSWMVIEIVAAVMQFLVPEFLLVGFGSSMGLFILYSELENPEAYLDRTAGCFSRQTFKNYVGQIFADLNTFSSIIVCNAEEWKLEEEEARSILVEMSEYLNSFSDSKLFRLNDNDFVLVYNKKEQEMNEIESAVNLDVIRERFNGSWGSGFHMPAKFLYIPDCRIANSAEEYISIYLRYRESFTADEVAKTLDESAGQNIRDLNEITLEIKDALRNNRIEVFYQPIYSIEAEKFVSAEALARLRGRDGKLIMPGKFIPVAEETGLIEQIGERVFTSTCNFINEKKLYELGIEYIEVNLSVAQSENPKLAEIYEGIMKRSGISPDRINLEITESSTLVDRNTFLNNIEKLINVGCSFSLDDFGTGESNLNYIVDMPVKIVKFDRSMVQRYFNNDRAKFVMKATVNMIKELGLKIVAEGVETEEQVEGIKKLGIDYIQGFYFSKPVSENDFIKFIEKNKEGVR